jgi:hypothetical protein
MKDAVEEVCEAISDVRQLLKENWEKSSSASARTTAITEDNVDDWRIEWLREVDKLLKMDAGWGWEQFFRMISYNICEKHAAASVCSSQLPAPNNVVEQCLTPIFSYLLNRKRVARLLPSFVIK